MPKTFFYGNDRTPASGSLSAPLPDLPVADVLPDVCRALADGADAILVAPPGSGKTTLAPLALLDAPWLARRRILLLEPRRMAARAAAWRMADLLGEVAGGRVGFRVRLERRESARTKLLVLTEGLLTRRMLHDPELSDTGLVIFDEFHERSLHADLALALCRDVQRSLRPDLRLLIMSATLDGDELARQLGGAVVLRAQGRQFPVETRFTPRPSHEPVPLQGVRASLNALSGQSGSVLTFLPGEGEIRHAERLLAAAADLPPDTDVHLLYGALPKTAQDAALRPAPAGRRKLVLATAIAESSLTIDGVSAVVDTGWMRVSRFSPLTGMQRLETLRVTRDRADQRRGRAGRLGPGVCYRLWDAAADTRLSAAAPPEILTADLAATVLAVADWGTSVPDALPWLTPPSEARWGQAVGLLQSLDALDQDGRITPHGRRMVQLPMHPRLAHMILRAAAGGAAETACLIAAILSERLTPSGPADRRTADLERLLNAVRDRGGGGIAPPRRDRVRALAREWLRAIGARPDAQATDAGACLAWAYPDRVARRRGTRGDCRYLLAGGRGGTLRPDDPLANHEWLVVAEIDDVAADALIRLAAALDSETVETQFAERIARRARLDWDRRRRTVLAVETECLGAITLRERPLSDIEPEALCRCLCKGIRLEGLERLGWTPAARQLQGRLELLRRMLPEQDWPDVSDNALTAALDHWLSPHLLGMRTFDQAAGIDLRAALSGWIGPQRRRDLDRLAPTHLNLPGGSRARLDYTVGELPVLAVRIQEAFGLRDTPRIAGGRAPVLIHLLSPARRPVQITTDLAGFWRTGYAQARKELRGRYPRHAWPETP